MKDEKKVTATQQEEFLHLVHRKLRQVEHMVKQLFDLSKMEAAEFVPKKEPFIFSEIVHEIIHASSSSALEKNIEIDCSVCESTSWIFADIGMMERVVQNLLINAIEYTPQNGFIKVSLTSHNFQLTFTIENSGESLSAELLEWFNQSGEAYKNKRHSSRGIGLTIVKKILHLHQYSFKAETIDRATNRFTITMPVLQNES
jgi:signal transduction histidine kinase